MSLRRFLLAGLAIPAGAALVVLATGRALWGHWGAPPSSRPSAAAVATLERFTSIWWGKSASGPAALAAAAADVSYVSGDEPDGRLPAALVERRLQPTSSAPVDGALLPSVVAAIEARGELRRGTPGYPNAADLHGHIAVGRSTTGNPVVVAALIGGEASNDHYPYYEAVLVPASGGQLSIQRLRFYWYDVAGLEGIAHWLAGALAAAGLTMVWALVGAYSFWRYRRAA